MNGYDDAAEGHEGNHVETLLKSDVYRCRSWIDVLLVTSTSFEWSDYIEQVLILTPFYHLWLNYSPLKVRLEHTELFICSFGVTLWEMISRKRPFSDMMGYQVLSFLLSIEVLLPPCKLSSRNCFRDQYFRQAMKWIYLQIQHAWMEDPGDMILPPNQIPTNLSPQAQKNIEELVSLVQDCTQMEASKRPSFHEICLRLKHLPSRSSSTASPVANDVKLGFLNWWTYAGLFDSLSFNKQADSATFFKPIFLLHLPRLPIAELPGSKQYPYQAWNQLKCLNTKYKSWKKCEQSSTYKCRMEMRLRYSRGLILRFAIAKRFCFEW